MQLPLNPLKNIERKYFFLSLILLLVITCVSINRNQGPLVELYDYWEHAACINELSKNLTEPDNPLIRTDGINTLRYTPYIFLAALLKKTTDLSLFSVITLLSILSFLLLASGVYLWSSEYFKNRTIPVYVLTALLFLWGEPFNYSNEYSLRFLSYTLFYPSIFTFNVSFIGLYFFLKYARYGKGRFYFLYLLTAAFVFVSHPLTGSFFLLCSFVLAVTEGKNSFKNILLCFFSLLIVFLLSFLWPYFSFMQAVISSVSTDWYFPFRMYLYNPGNIFKMGPALLALPILLLFFINKKHSFIIYGFFLSLSVYIISYLANIRLGERYIFFIMVFLHLSLAWYFSRLKLLSFSSMKNMILHLSDKNIHVLFFLVVLTEGICYQGLKLGFEQAGYTLTFDPEPIVQKYKNPLDDYMPLSDKIGNSDVVMSDTLTSWIIPALTGAKIVSLYHNNPMVPDNKSRVENTVKFYRPETPYWQRVEILRKYGATHVLLNFERMKENEVNRINDYYRNFHVSKNMINDCKKMGKIVFKNDAFLLFKIDNK